MMNKNRRSGLATLIGATALIMAACGSVDRATSAPHGTTATIAQPPCGPFALFDGSTFESVGLGEPTVTNPATGRKSNVYFRFCGGRYAFLYVDLMPSPARSHASVIHSLTVSSTSSGPRTLTT